MQVQLPYSNEKIEVAIPDGATLALPREMPGVEDIGSEICQAIEHPIGSPLLRNLARGKRDAVIVINDITRPAPSKDMLECILDELARGGIPDDGIQVVIANGNHRPNTPQEIESMIGRDLSRRLRVNNHDCEDRSLLTEIPVPGFGSPVLINSRVAKASLKILTGLIGPHQSAGYSGGRKSLVPGVAGLDTIARHHSFPIRPYEPSMGWMDGNPFHELSVQISRAAGVDFIVNVVKNWRGEVVRAVAGDLVDAHRAGVLACEKSWVVDLPRKYEVVIVTPGGYPRDIDLHQAQKALASAELAVTPGGVIVLIAACQEGAGKFFAWFEGASSPDEIISRFKKEGFTREQSSKAFMCARALKSHRIIVASKGIPRDQLKTMFFEHAESPQDAIRMALSPGISPDNILVMPYAIDCLPRVAEPVVME